MTYRFSAVIILLMGTACAGQAAQVADLPPAPASVVEQPTSLTTPTGAISGTTMLPAAEFPVPVVLIIAGSGPTDRNGNSRVIPGANNSLRQFAEGLAASGIASVRYDKRGVAESASAGGKEEDLRFDHYVSDAAGWIRQLRADRRFSTVAVAGHSEGSLIAMIAAREAGADGFISIAGIGRKASRAIHDQLAVQLPPPMLAHADQVMASLDRGEKPDSVSPLLNALFRPSVQPYLISWFRRAPTEELARLRAPALIIQGTTDLQVTVDDAKMLSAAKPDARLVIVEGMNHVLKSVSGPIQVQLPTYSNPDLTIPQQIVSESASFVKSLRRR
jgi:pimeloyl-ACP methyl ester carboxylesterase